MVLEFCGVKLRRIDAHDLEMLRQWRNDTKIAQFMFVQDHISRDQQVQWFKNLGAQDFYFIIEYEKAAIGLINLSRRNKQNTEAHAGLFVYNEKYWGGPLPVLASICLLDFAFESQNLKKVIAKVQSSNFEALEYNRRLGFVQESKEYQLLTLENYRKSIPKLKHAAVKVYGKGSV